MVGAVVVVLAVQQRVGGASGSRSLGRRSTHGLQETPRLWPMPVLRIE
eukprot:COSAG06_NODE_56578_length_284_cov_0.729730_1_plen_47_part_10